MLCRIILVLALSVLGIGCSPGGASAPPAADHPANSIATESPIAPPSPTLTVATTAPTQEPPEARGDMGGMNHSTSGMQHNNHSVATQPATTQATAIYTCTMHPEVISDKPGNCPKCGMKLVKKEGSR